MTTQRTKPLFASYSNTYLYRSEVYIFRQLSGMRHADVKVLAQWTANLQEFPATSIYCAENARSSSRPDQERNASTYMAVRNRYTLPPYVIRRLHRQIKDMSPMLSIVSLAGTHRNYWTYSRRKGLSARCRSSFRLPGPISMQRLSIGPEYVLPGSVRSFDRSALILCCSNFLVSKVLQAGAPAEQSKTSLYREWISPRIWASTSRPRRGDKFRILAVSRLSPVKGVRHTIAAFASVAAGKCRMPSWK